MTCQIELMNAGGAYPRSCPTCGLFGKCAKGLVRNEPKPVADMTESDTPERETPLYAAVALIPTLRAESRVQKVRANEYLASILEQAADSITPLCDELTAANAALVESEASGWANFNALQYINDWLIERDLLKINHEGDADAAAKNVTDSIAAISAALAEAREKVKELTMSRDLLQARVNTISQVSQQLSLAEKVVKLQDLLEEANLTIARLRAPNITGG